jgi:hypothetical protein
MPFFFQYYITILFANIMRFYNVQFSFSEFFYFLIPSITSIKFSSSVLFCPFYASLMEFFDIWTRYISEMWKLNSRQKAYDKLV